jgi:hypothetical protein
MTAEHQSRYRARQRRGLVVLPIEVDEVALAFALERAGLLSEDVDDRDNLARALEKLVALWCEQVGEP